MKNLTFNEIRDMDEFYEVKDLFFAGSADMATKLGNHTLYDINALHPAWSAEDMLFGLERLRELCNNNGNIVHDVYPDARGARSDVKMVVFKADKQVKDEVYILVSGGGYGVVCNLVEAFPVAAKLNQLGYSCVCLCYRVARKETFENGLLPKPIFDLAAALKRISALNLTLNADNYTVIGFSAGGHLAACWGGDIGYIFHKAVKPKRLVLVYPLLDLHNLAESIPKNISDRLMTGLLGKGYTEETIRKYSPIFNVGRDYPPCYIVHAEDDDAVNVGTTKAFIKKLKENEIEVAAEIVQSGGHGFGLGEATAARGYVERVLKL